METRSSKVSLKEEKNGWLGQGKVARERGRTEPGEEIVK